MKKIASVVLAFLLLFTFSAPALAKAETKAETETSTSIPYPKKGWYKAGKYTVGEDIPAGEYIIVATDAGTNLSFSLKGKDAGELRNGFAIESISDSCVGRRYITLKKGQKLEVKKGKLIKVSKMPPYEPEKENVWPGGMYKVGYDIPAGTYKVTAPKDARCPTRILHMPNTSEPTEHSIVMPGKSKEFTVENGQYIQLQWKGTMTLVSLAE